jgi:hypothetical protein
MIVERGEAVHGQSEAGDPGKQSLHVRLVDDRTRQFGQSIVRIDRHAVKRRGVPVTQLSFDNDLKAVSCHASLSLAQSGSELGIARPGSPG